MIDTSRFCGHQRAFDFDLLEGADAEDFLVALEADEAADEGEDHEAALDAWREQRDAEDDEPLPCGLTRHQLRLAARELFAELAVVLGRILRMKQGTEVKRGRGSGAKVSASQVAAIGCALQLPGFERSATLARQLGVTRASVSIWSAEFGRVLGVTSEMSARKQAAGIIAMARIKAGLRPSKGGDIAPLHTAEEMRESPETLAWLSSLPADEAEQARRALKGRVA